MGEQLQTVTKDIRAPTARPNCKYWPVILLDAVAGIMILSKINLILNLLAQSTLLVQTLKADSFLPIR